MKNKKRIEAPRIKLRGMRSLSLFKRPRGQGFQ
jgi:hypothetical protein